MPVTCFSADTTRDLVKCLASAKGIDNLSPLGSPRAGVAGDGAPLPRQELRHSRYDLFHRHNTPAAAGSSGGGISGFARSLRRRMRLEPARPPRDTDGAAGPSDSEFDVEIVSVDSAQSSPVVERRASRTAAAAASKGPDPAP